MDVVSWTETRDTHAMAGADTVFRGKMGETRGLVLSNRITVNMGAEAEQDCRLFYKK